VALDKAIGSGSPGATTAGGQSRETGAVRLLLNRAWREENSWNKAGSEHVFPRTPALQGWEFQHANQRDLLVCMRTIS